VATILLIDDSELVLDIMREMLLELRHEVLATSNPVEFLRLLQSSPPPALAIVDAIMPNVGGDELISQVRAMSDPLLAELPVIMATALTNPKPSAPGVLILSKPFTLDELSRAIDFALGCQ